MPSIEDQLFTWDSRDAYDVLDITYFDVALKVPIGKFPVGTKFSYAVLVLGLSQLSLHLDGDKIGIHFPLKLTIGEP